MSNTELMRAIEKAEELLDDMTVEEVYQYAFDRLVDEFIAAGESNRRNGGRSV